MATLLDGIPVAEMNTSMTINAPAAWLLGLHIANAADNGVTSDQLRGTTQNDIVKEYLSRGTYIFPPLPSRRLIVDVFAFCAQHVPRWNPMNVCSYHLQEGGGHPGAGDLVLAGGGDRGARRGAGVGAGGGRRLRRVVASMSFFVNSGIRFVEETCKMRAFTQLWDRITAERYGVRDPRARRFRYGVQVNSLGLTEASRRTTCTGSCWKRSGDVGHAMRVPGRCSSLRGTKHSACPGRGDQQWSLRVQQILAIGDRPARVRRHLRWLARGGGEDRRVDRGGGGRARRIAELGGVFEAIDELKGRLVQSHAERMRRIESGEQTVVGVNSFTETAPSPLGGTESILRVDPQVQDELIADVAAWRSARDESEVKRCLDELRRAAAGTDNIMVPTIALAHAGGTTGEWADCLRDVFGEFRAPTGVRAAGSLDAGRDGDRARLGGDRPPDAGAGRRPTADPDRQTGSRRPLERGPSRSRWRPATRGMEVIYEGIRSTPAQIAAVARDEDPDAIGLSILSGSHLELVPETLARLSAEGVDAPVVVGGIIPAEIERSSSITGWLPSSPRPTTGSLT